MLQITAVQSRRDLKAFARVPHELYADDPLWVPPIIREQMETLDAKRNPAFQEAEAKLFMVHREGRPVGRVAAILSRAANRHHGTRNLRFGWFDVADDYQAAEALLRAVEDWARQLNMDTITGPQGLCDLDPQGLLIDGFEHLPSIATIYNRPYLARFLERYGFGKDKDYVELLLQRERQSGMPPRVQRLLTAVQRRSHLRILEFRGRREAMAWVPQALDILNETFLDLYGVVPLTPSQMDYYVKKFYFFLDRDFMVAVVDQENRLQGFALAIPSLSQPFQRAKGRLLPWGWWHILRGLRASKTLDFCLVGVRKRFQGQGLNALMMARLYEKGMDRGFLRAETYPILEDNKLSLSLLDPFKPICHKRRRVYIKPVGPAPAHHFSNQDAA